MTISPLCIAFILTNSQRHVIQCFFFSHLNRYIALYLNAYSSFIYIFMSTLLGAYPSILKKKNFLRKKLSIYLQLPSLSQSHSLCIADSLILSTTSFSSLNSLTRAFIILCILLIPKKSEIAHLYNHPRSSFFVPYQCSIFIR